MTEFRRNPRFPRYWVGVDGRTVGPRGWVLKPSLCGNGYWSISVFEAGVSRAERVNVLVCETYHGPRVPGMQAAHLDGNRANNVAINLRWKTHLENDADKDLHGTRTRGEQTGRTNLTADHVRWMRIVYRTGAMNIPQLAALHGLDKSGVAKIINGQRWGHIK